MLFFQDINKCDLVDIVLLYKLWISLVNQFLAVVNAHGS